MAIDSLHEDTDLDELIADTTSLIASVYDILDQSNSVQTARTPNATTPTPLLGRRSLNNSSDSVQHGSNSISPKSPKTPRLGLLSRTPLSTQSSQEIDREINRIDRFCEMLEHNLRSVSSGQQAASRSVSTSPTTPSATIKSPRSTPRRHSETQPTNNQRRSLTSEEVIDLCDSLYVPAPMTLPYSFNSSSDDVIIVTPTGEEVVDLCTPTFDRNNAARARNNYRRTIDFPFEISNTTNATTAAARPRLVPSRRTLAPTGARSSCSSISAVTSTTNIAAVAPVGQHDLQTARKTNNAPAARCDKVNISETASDNSGRVSFMCAVCMESYINNQPTSTECGHVFCSNCIRKAIRLTRKCPMCNTKVTAHTLFRIYF